MFLLPAELISSSILRGCWLNNYLGGRQVLDRNLARIRSLWRHYSNTRALQSPIFSCFREFRRSCKLLSRGDDIFGGVALFC